jgi:retron-type reverse transcriptase
VDWFADLKRLGNKSGEEKLQHYRYRLERKAHGGLRLIEMPKPRIRKLQRQILDYLLNRIPTHPAAHGFVRGRGILTFAAPHAGKPIVLRLDLQDFFPRIYGPRVQTLFRTCGYPEAVADRLGGICTNVVPHSAWECLPDGISPNERIIAQALYRSSHLPQGAPTSPALANLCAYRLDCRLSGLAKAAGAAYTRYADDLAFSGDTDFARGVERFAAQVTKIVGEERFRVNPRKTRVMREGVRQYLAGLVVNEKPNISRDTFDQLKAILTNCIRHGAASQNREGHPHFRAHLEGRVSFVESVNAVKGQRLRVLFDGIHWD